MPLSERDTAYPNSSLIAVLAGLLPGSDSAGFVIAIQEENLHVSQPFVKLPIPWRANNDVVTLGSHIHSQPKHISSCISADVLAKLCPVPAIIGLVEDFDVSLLDFPHPTLN
jgi:hypothetical protein